MKKYLMILISAIIITVLTSCSKSVNNHDGSVWISIENNGIANATQDIKVITFDGKELQEYEIIDNEDGSITVVLKIDNTIKSKTASE